MKFIKWIAYFVLNCSFSYSQAPSETAEVQKLQAFIGTWATEGRWEASPFGPASRWTGVSKREWCPGKFAVLRHDEKRYETGSVEQDIVLFYYDVPAKSFRAFSVAGNGITDAATLVFSQDSMTWRWEVQFEGKHYAVRGILKPLSSNVREFIGEYSTDENNWKVLVRSKDTKIK